MSKRPTFKERLDVLDLPDYGRTPTPEQIREMCGIIQTTWTERERRDRETWKPVQWELPEMRKLARRAA